jgi:O-antigen ligase
MKNLTTAALFFLAAGIFTSVTVLSAYQILLAAPLIYFSYLVIKNKEINLPQSAYFLLAFAAVAILSLVLNYDLVPKPSKNFGRVKYFIFAVGSIFVFRFWLKEASDKIKKNLVSTLLVTVVIAGIFMIYKSMIAVPNDRVRGLTDTMRYGYGTSMILLTIISAVLHREKIKNWFDWKLALAAVVFGFIGIYLTQTRGAILGFACGFPFVLYFYKPKIGIIVGALAVIIVGALGINYQFGNVEHGEGSRILMNKENKSDMMRRSQWTAAVIAIKEKPVLGWGLSNFHTQLKRIKHEYDLEAKFYDNAHSHNLFLEVGAGTGLIGLLLFIGWVVMWAKEAFQAGGLIRAMIVPFGVAFVISSQFEVTFDANNASMIFFLYSMSVAIKEKSQT